ncbi:MAG TPA: anaerobic C4-dicarboxylate transporter family protein [Dinghuibacter sp.]|uniref:anaerobic C4-dicarboxylate transporter family protein n=1 Tax=Dinghuibacter sp. TaxID=2024697 RepID=UPI002BDD1D3C|nr:anaerobic C4-dicarboxylate transporter family protein [Dinghuibacter sp.]HTJ12360.1 anaerobic C4-dicarboxylate transporter family protein [Dinghuibacter sp.]
MIWIQLAILLTMILLGARMKGIGLGVMGMIGMLIFVVVFHLRPGEPPLDVMMIILSIVTTAACMQAAGGLDYLVYLAEKLIRRNPSRVVFLGPIVVFFLALFAGTSHVVYSMLPIIYEVSLEKRIRPERPLSISVIASHIALTGSPMAAATAALAAILGYPGAAVDIMRVAIPACFIGMLAGAASVLRMGRDLPAVGPLPGEAGALPEGAAPAAVAMPAAAVARTFKPGAKTAVYIFGAAILAVVLAGSLPWLLPHWPAGKATFSVNADGTLKMVTVIEIVTLAASAAILAFTPTRAADVPRTGLFTSMAIALVSVFGVVWMSATFMENNQLVIQNALGGIAKAHPWTFSIVAFIMGVLMFSQAATTKVVMPLGLALGLPAPVLIAIFPAVNSDWVLPGYPTLLAAIQIDKTGSTRIGKWLLNHSFIRPGIVTVVVAIAVGFALAKVLL